LLLLILLLQGYKELYSRKWAYTQELAVSIQVGPQPAAASHVLGDPVAAEPSAMHKANSSHGWLVCVSASCQLSLSSCRQAVSPPPCGAGVCSLHHASKGRH
jgi:hypothetical protein